jgi:hypothetical protein
MLPLVTLGILVFIFTFFFSHNIFATTQTLHNQTLEETSIEVEGMGFEYRRASQGYVTQAGSEGHRLKL